MARARERSARGGVRAVGSALASVVFFTGVLLVRVTAEEAGPGFAPSRALDRDAPFATVPDDAFDDDAAPASPPAFAGPSGEHGARDAASRLGEFGGPTNGSKRRRSRPEEEETASLRDAGKAARKPAYWAA